MSNIINVSPEGPLEPLENILNSASDNDEIHFAPGIYVLSEPIMIESDVILSGDSEEFPSIVGCDMAFRNCKSSIRNLNFLDIEEGQENYIDIDNNATITFENVAFQNKDILKGYTINVSNSQLDMLHCDIETTTNGASSLVSTNSSVSLDSTTIDLATINTFSEIDLINAKVGQMIVANNSKLISKHDLFMMEINENRYGLLFQNAKVYIEKIKSMPNSNINVSLTQNSDLYIKDIDKESNNLVNVFFDNSTKTRTHIDNGTYALTPLQTEES